MWNVSDFMEDFQMFKAKMNFSQEGSPLVTVGVKYYVHLGRVKLRV